MLNRKGHIGTTLLVFLALVLSVGTLFTFASFKDDINANSQEFRQGNLELKEKQVMLDADLRVFINGVLVSLDKSNDFEKEFRDLFKDHYSGFKRKGSFTNFYGKVVGRDYSLKFDGENYTLEIKDVFIHEKTKKVVLKETFSYEIKFNQDRIFEFKKEYE